MLVFGDQHRGSTLKLQRLAGRVQDSAWGVGWGWILSLSSRDAALPGYDAVIMNNIKNIAREQHEFCFFYLSSIIPKPSLEDQVGKNERYKQFWQIHVPTVTAYGLVLVLQEGNAEQQHRSHLTSSQQTQHPHEIISGNSSTTRFQLIVLVANHNVIKNPSGHRMHGVALHAEGPQMHQTNSQIKSFQIMYDML